MKLDIFENFIGKLLHPSKQSLSQTGYNEIKLQCHNIAIMLERWVKSCSSPSLCFYFSPLS